MAHSLKHRFPKCPSDGTLPLSCLIESEGHLSHALFTCYPLCSTMCWVPGPEHRCIAHKPKPPHPQSSTLWALVLG